MAEPESGEHTDFSTLYEANYRHVFNYILYGTGEVETALDLTSETFFKALRAWPKFEHRGASSTAWLLKIASRELAMFYRRQRRSKISPLSFSEEVVHVRNNVNESEVRDALRELESRDEFAMLSPLIRKLPFKYRQVVFMRFFEDLSIEDISRSLGRPAGTVKSQLHRALKHLREDMQPSGAAGHFMVVDSDAILSAPALPEEVD